MFPDRSCRENVHELILLKPCRLSDNVVQTGRAGQATVTILYSARALHAG